MMSGSVLTRESTLAPHAKFRFDSRHQLTVYLEISNVTNRRNDCCMEYQIEDEEGPHVPGCRAG